MAGITVKNKATGDVLTFDTVAEVSNAAAFIGYVKAAWDEGVLLKPTGTGTSVFTASSPGPFPGEVYGIKPSSGMSSASSNNCLQQMQRQWQELCLLAVLSRNPSCSTLKSNCICTIATLCVHALKFLTLPPH